MYKLVRPISIISWVSELFRLFEVVLKKVISVVSGAVDQESASTWGWVCMFMCVCFGVFFTYVQALVYLGFLNACIDVRVCKKVFCLVKHWQSV